MKTRRKSRASFQIRLTKRSPHAIIGFECDNLQIMFATIYMTNCDIGINANGLEIYTTLAKIVVENCNVAINSADTIIFIESKINIINCFEGIVDDDKKSLMLNLTDLYISTISYCLKNVQIVEINDSRLILKSINDALNEKIIK